MAPDGVKFLEVLRQDALQNVLIALLDAFFVHDFHGEEGVELLLNVLSFFEDERTVSGEVGEDLER